MVPKRSELVEHSYVARNNGVHKVLRLINQAFRWRTIFKPHLSEPNAHLGGVIDLSLSNPVTSGITPVEVAPEGLEPSTLRLRVACSAN